jgi:hypothetical protein
LATRITSSAAGTPQSMALCRQTSTAFLSRPFYTILVVAVNKFRAILPSQNYQAAFIV